MSGYDHKTIEPRWQDRWQQQDAYRVGIDKSKPKYYVLDMFPYPSGVGLHVGHPKGYVATDIVARARRMMGHNVLRVMGWDSFGLPSERQAEREGTHPRDVTDRNVATFKGQLQRLGLSYDWSREIATSDVGYYKWTQWIFLKLFEKGLAYEADVPVNWCPALGTVLANEEVKDGVYIETGDPVERRSMRQWMLKITDYAESLLAGLDDLDWPEGVKEMQRHWIGRSEGASVKFSVQDSTDSVEVFTTRPDTLFGGTYLVLAPEHPLVTSVTTAKQADAVQAYCVEAANRSDRDRQSDAPDHTKTGVFTGSYAINPVNDEPIPIWVADYVLMGYGTGAIFACPAHDDRDFEFARQFGLPIIEVVAGGNVDEAAYTGPGPHVNSGFLDGLDEADAKRKIIDFLEANDAGTGTVNYRLRDWLFSRQRYWGEPMPIVHPELADGSRGAPRAVTESELPVTLPDLTDYRPTEDGAPPLARAAQWMHTIDPETGEALLRETNTMPQWAGSCWYYLRFISPNRDDVAWDPEDEAYWMPVDLYVGGAEHATLHLLYSRFWQHVLHDLGLVSTREPFQRLFNQGMVHATSFKDERGKYYYREEVKEAGDGFVNDAGEPLVTRREKMSKSRYNVVNPDDMCDQFGADSLRLYELFMSPLEDGGDWDNAGVLGMRRFLDRVWRLIMGDGTERDSGALTEAASSADVQRALHNAIRNVTEAVDTLKFNTAIADMIVFVNEATKAKAVSRNDMNRFLRILAPFAPHLAEELWQALGETNSIVAADWPEFDEAKLKSDTITIAVQVMGKLRGKIEVDADADKDTVLAAAKAEENVSRFLEGKTIRKEVFVPGRLVNFVAN
ncbi:MAG: leucine--tRNA ligase [Pseudomonadaceae bacterium]|nr:leucine--tRNA ligase [Pseudomonadaceae bacterium]